MVLYFTGTGNSRYLARRIAEGLDMPLYDLNTCIKAGDTAPVQTGQDVVLVTPTYAWRIPRVVSQWLGNTELTGAERIWFVMDCGSEIGNAAKYNRQLAAQKHLRYMGTAQIIMPENYIAMFNAPQAEQARRIVEQAEPALQKALAQVRAGQEFSPLRDTLYDRFMSGPVNPAFYRFFVKADAFRATDACIGCGACVAACPNASAMLFTGAKISHLGLLPQGQPERLARVVSMLNQHDAEGFGGCTNIGECAAVCPKSVPLEVISRLNRDLGHALWKGQHAH